MSRPVSPVSLSLSVSLSPVSPVSPWPSCARAAAIRLWAADTNCWRCVGGPHRLSQLALGRCAVHVTHRRICAWRCLSRGGGAAVDELDRRQCDEGAPACPASAARFYHRGSSNACDGELDLRASERERVRERGNGRRLMFGYGVAVCLVCVRGSAPLARLLVRHSLSCISRAPATSVARIVCVCVCVCVCASLSFSPSLFL